MIESKPIGLKARVADASTPSLRAGDETTCPATTCPSPSRKHRRLPSLSAFVSSRNLDHVMLTHTGEFRCLYWASNSSENPATHLKQHLLKHLGILLFRPMDTILTISLLLKTLHTWVTRHGEHNMVLIRKPCPFWLMFTVLEDAIHTTGREKLSSLLPNCATGDL